MRNKKWNRSSSITSDDLAFLTVLQTVAVTRTLRAIRSSTGWTPDQMQANRAAITEALNRLTKSIHDGIDRILKGDE
jgi:hypothetical protein